MSVSYTYNETLLFAGSFEPAFQAHLVSAFYNYHFEHTSRPHAGLRQFGLIINSGFIDYSWQFVDGSKQEL